MNLGLHLTQSDYNGRWYFVGTVPIELGYVTKDGGPVTPELIESQHMLPASYRSIKTRMWTDRDEAIELAESMGFKVTYREEET